MRPLPTRYFHRPAELVAPDLLGATIVSTIGGRPTSGTIVETEAYLGRDDPASHAYGGRRHAGNASLYGSPGTWYVYRSYGVHWCANLVCDGSETGGAVLLRGILPLRGVSTVRRRRGAIQERMLANGPGKLCQALGITHVLDGIAMRRSAVQVFESAEKPVGTILVTPRIGISKAVEWPLRFLLRPSREVSAIA
ncbi:MAG TPA: DNA-3-methyladenine glycosylase [Gemmatimonadales bacterium]|nr:DNA-3-methyladenine glycosylase [Gemmatimonadales bacterium]